jgi:hypothetical protein
MTQRVARYVVVPQRFDDNGKFSVDHRPPYGYHHIIMIHEDKSYLLVAMVFASKDDDKGLAVARVVANDLPIDIEPDFYNQQRDLMQALLNLGRYEYEL